ncbi:exodeoxyribonuclease VII large subunit [Pusillimonas caeni]|uniref:exodeoxyribonuclease VII large subunit n=1 Tax=Pusillimonas caeni TaxID=1348472 RepID=UPI000E599FFA|nr:exodeoxyribonuclease VII large subunit [Pusillimonas caeni]TFL11434.1 exodeoxyribonuclease VII large subunit [Pusillimonas caeni]
MFSSSSPLNDAVLTVSQLNRQVGNVLEGHFSQVWVRGEISNFTRAASGHWYFTLKDESAAVRAVMFRGRAQAVGFTPRPGERFELRANVTLYQARGDYQLQVEAMRRAGQGDLHEAFLALKARLGDEGLFDPLRKRAIATMPRAVGVVTSLAAAALRDVLSAMARRAPHVRVVIYPAPVQGADAAGLLCQALSQAIARGEVDTLLLVRGGGSLEDLWSFNDEALARVIAASPIPIVSGVGHETDFTIADFVADLRAPTPTAAAELCCLPRQACLERVDAAMQSMALQQRRWFERAALRLDRAVGMLVSPQERLDRQSERLQSLKLRLARAAAAQQRAQTDRLAMAGARLAHRRPDIAALRAGLRAQTNRLAACTPHLVATRRSSLNSALQTLEALNPRKILNRGYAIVRDESGALVKNALDLNKGDRLVLELGQGGADVEVIRPIQK